MKVKYIKKYSFIAIPLCITVIMLLLRLVRFSSVDDMYMMSMAESLKTNTHSEHLFFMSFVLGYIFRFLYSITMAINWFCLTEIFAATFVFISLHRIVQHFDFCVPVSLLLMAVQIYLLNNITYTALSFMLPVTGVLWALSYAEKLTKKNLRHLVYAFALMLFGFAFRPGNSFFCVILICIPLIFFEYIKKRNSLAVAAIVLVLCCAANYSLIGAGKIYNSNHPEPQLYYDVSAFRSEAYDHALPDYEENREALEAVNLSQNDLRLLHHALYADVNVFTPEAFKAVAQCRDLNDTYELNPIRLLKDFYISSRYLINNLVLVFLLLSVLCLILMKNRRLELLAIMLFVGANIGYLFVRKRGLIRVYNPIAMCGIFILLYLLLQEKDNISKRLKTKFGNINFRRIMIVVCALFVAVHACTNIAFTEVRNNHADNVIAEIESDTQHVYVAHAWAHNYMHNRRLSVFRKNFTDIPVIVTLGEWYLYSDYWNDYHEQHHIKEYAETPYLYLLQSDVVYLTEYPDHAEMICQFFNEHYGLNVTYTEVKEMHDEENRAVYYVFDFCEV